MFMLVLTRKEKEGISIFINKKKVLSFTIAELDERKVRLHFDGNDDVIIVRNEIADDFPK